MNKERTVKDPRTYSIGGLHAAGMRFTDDYTAEDAIEAFLELHPDADEAAVRAELRAELIAMDWPAAKLP